MMTATKVDRTLAEVWEWKEKVRLEEESWEDIPAEERLKRRNEESKKIKKKLGLTLPTLSLSGKHTARAS